MPIGTICYVVNQQRIFEYLFSEFVFGLLRFDAVASIKGCDRIVDLKGSGHQSIGNCQ
jgi:hypothetical protein